jgi:hypothetical protein
LYSGSLKNGERSPIYAFGFVFILALANFYIIFDTVSIILDFKLVSYFSGYLGILFTVSFYFLLYILLWGNGKKEAILKEFQNEDKSKKLLRSLLLWIYAITTIILFVYTGNIVRSMHIK